MNENPIEIPHSSITGLTLSMLKQGAQSIKTRTAVLASKIVFVVMSGWSVLLIPICNHVLDNAEVGA